MEAGCGSGGALPHLAGRFEHVVGLDVDLPALIVAARRCLERGLFEKVMFVAAMLEQQIFAAGTFDAIKSTDVIEHVEPILGRAARPVMGGAVYAETRGRLVRQVADRSVVPQCGVAAFTLEICSDTPRRRSS
jgi:SAM-dependent methyltransferase